MANVAVDYTRLYSTDADTQYYYYEGSLTSPECNEAVTWIISKEYNQVSEDQLTLLRSLKMTPSALIGSNYRPLQPINEREIRATFDQEVPVSSYLPLQIRVVLGMTLLLMILML